MSVQTNQITTVSNQAVLEKEMQSIQPRLEKIVPANFPIDRFKFAVLEAVRKSKTAAMTKCTLASTFGAMLTCAELGLMPNTTQQHAYLVPFWNNDLKQYEMSFQIGYRGLVELAFRYKVAKKVWAEAVYQGDRFEYMMGTEQYIVHVPDFGATRDDSTMLAVYAVIETDHGTQFTIMAKSEVDKIRDQASQAAKYKGTPWDVWYTEMAKKTVLKRLMKTIAVSPEIAMANEVDGQAEAGIAVNYEMPGTKQVAPKATTSDVDALLAGKVPQAVQDGPEQPQDPEPANEPPRPTKAPDAPAEPAKPAPVDKRTTEPSKEDLNKALETPAPAAPAAKAKRVIDKMNTLHNFPQQFDKMVETAGKCKWGYNQMSVHIMEKYGIDNPRDIDLNIAAEVMKYMEATKVGAK